MHCRSLSVLALPLLAHAAVIERRQFPATTDLAGIIAPSLLPTPVVTDIPTETGRLSAYNSDALAACEFCQRQSFKFVSKFRSMVHGRAGDPCRSCRHDDIAASQYELSCAEDAVFAVQSSRSRP